MFKLTGKNALVTGSTRGLGKAIALGLAKEGANIILNSSNDTILSFLNGFYEAENCRKIHKINGAKVLINGFTFKENCPDAKIIAIVRDPIYRTFSDYLHAQRKGDISPTFPFAEYIKDEKKLEFGCYTQYLKQFFDNFPAEQIKVIVLEDFNENYEKGFREVFEFLGLKNVPLPLI